MRPCRDCISVTTEDDTVRIQKGSDVRLQDGIREKQRPRRDCTEKDWSLCRGRISIGMSTDTGKHKIDVLCRRRWAKKLYAVSRATHWRIKE